MVQISGSGVQACFAEFLLEMDLKILLRKTGARLIFKVALISLQIDPGQWPFDYQSELDRVIAIINQHLNYWKPFLSNQMVLYFGCLVFGCSLC